MHLHRIEIEAFRKQPENEVNSLRMTLSLYQSPMKYTILEENWTPEGAPEDFEPIDRKEYDWDSTKFLHKISWIANLKEGYRTTAEEGSEEYRRHYTQWVSWMTSMPNYRAAIQYFHENYFQESQEDAS